jgi:hypothetical protein
METEKMFDMLARSIGRRGLVAGSLAALLPGSVLAVPACRPVGHPCEGNQDCCADGGAICLEKGEYLTIYGDGGNARRCGVRSVDPPTPQDPDHGDPKDKGSRAIGGPGGSRKKCRSGNAQSKRCRGSQKREHCHHDDECAPGFRCVGGRDDSGQHRSCQKVG